MVNINQFIIGIVSPLPPPYGGIASWTETFIRYLSNSGCSVSTINTALIGRRANNPTHKVNILDELKRSVNIYRRLKTLTNTTQFDFIHYNSSLSRFGIFRDYLLIRYLKKHKIKVLTHYHCNIKDALYSRFRKSICGKIATLSSYNVVLNYDSMSTLKEITPQSKIRVVPNFVNADLLVDDKKINDKVQNIYFVGNIIESKGVREIIDFAKISPYYNFFLIGQLSTRLIKEINLPENVILLGRKSHQETISLLSKADVFLFPSHTEGFSMAILEAMALGIPIIATEVGAAKDMLIDGGGILVRQKNIQDIIEAFRNIEDMNTRIFMSKVNVNAVKQKYKSDLVLEQILDLYREMI